MLFLYGFLVWTLAAFVNGVTSFGGNLVGTPLMMLAIAPKDAIVFASLLGFAIMGTISFVYRHRLPVKETVLAVLSGAAGVPAGVAILRWAPTNVLLFLASAAIFLFLLWQLIAKRIHFRGTAPLWTVIPAGLAAGIVMGATSMGGPMLAMFAMMRGWTKETIIAVLNTVGTLSSLPFIFTLWQQDMYTADVTIPALCTMPAAVLGILISVPVMKRIDVQVFRRLMLCMLTLSALTLLVRGLDV